MHIRNETTKKFSECRLYRQVASAAYPDKLAKQFYKIFGLRSDLTGDFVPALRGVPVAARRKPQGFTKLAIKF